MLTKNYKGNLFILLFFKFFVDFIIALFFLITRGINHTIAIFRAYISFYKKLKQLMIIRKSLKQEISHYNAFSIVFYFIGLKKVKKV